MQRGLDFAGVFPTGVIVVLEDVSELLTFKPLCELGLEDFRAAGIGGLDQAKCGDVVGILFSLAKPHRLGR